MSPASDALFGQNESEANGRFGTVGQFDCHLSGTVQIKGKSQKILKLGWPWMVDDGCFNEGFWRLKCREADETKPSEDDLPDEEKV